MKGKNIKYPIALTGGIGSGKTTVAKLFKKIYNIDIVCADQCAKDVLYLPEIIDEVVNKLGIEIISSKKVIDRKKLRNIIANNKSKRAWLNKLMHPIIRERIKDKIVKSSSSYAIIDIPLLTQQSIIHYPYIKKVILVSSLLEIKVSRIIKRDSQNREQVLAMIDSQINDFNREKFSDFIITNNADMTSLISQIKQINQKICMYCDRN